MLVYGKEARLHISLEFPTLELAYQLKLIEDDVMSIRMEELMEKEEKRHQAIQTLEAHQQQVKKSFDKKAKFKIFKEGDLFLKWDTNRVKVGRH